MSNLLTSMSTREIGKALGLKSRQRVFSVARREGWRALNPNRDEQSRFPQEYFASDVLRYARARQRTILAATVCKIFGIPSVKGLLRDAQYDTRCPTCGHFAILVPLSERVTPEKVIEYVALKEKGKLPWACVQGHSSNGNFTPEKDLTFPDLPWHILKERQKLELPAQK